jgi:hypothetical protein
MLAMISSITPFDTAPLLIIVIGLIVVAVLSRLKGGR